jgi:hypothetical protein
MQLQRGTAGSGRSIFWTVTVRASGAEDPHDQLLAT